MKPYTVLTEYPYNSGEICVHHVLADNAQAARETACREEIEYARKAETEEGLASDLDPDHEWEDVFVCAIFAGHLDDLSVGDQ